MKKLIVLALGAMLVGNLSAREVKRVGNREFEFRKGEKIVIIKECPVCHERIVKFADKRRGEHFRMEAAKREFRKGNFRKAEFRRGEFDRGHKGHKAHRRP